MQNKIRELRKKRGLSCERLSQLTEESAELLNKTRKPVWGDRFEGISAQHLNRLEKNERRLNDDNSVVIATALGVGVEQLREEGVVSLRGTLGKDGLITFFSKATAEKVPCPPELPESDITAVKILGNHLYPFLDGWIIYYTERMDVKIPRPPGAKDWQEVDYNGANENGIVLNRPYIVTLKDGRVMLRTVKAGSMPGRYTLVIHNSPDDIVNAEIAAIARIVYIKT